MPTIVKPDEVPTFVRSGQVSQWADALNFMVGLFTDPKQPADVSIKFEKADGVTKVDWGQMATALRTAAKNLGYKVIVVYRDEQEGEDSSKTTPVLYVKRDGEPKVLAPEVKEARQAKAEATRQAKLAELAALKPAERAAVDEYVQAVRAERKAEREAARAEAAAEAAAEAEAAKTKTSAKK